MKTGTLRAAARRICAVALWCVVVGAQPHAAELHESTARAFDVYATAVEARPVSPFLWLDSLPAADRDRRAREVRNGGLVIERLRARPGGRDIDVPGGLIHHWIGTAFVPHGTTAAALRLLQDYDRHASVYAPIVARSRLLSKSGDEFRFSLRFVMTKVITVVVDGEHQARFASLGPHRARSWIRSARLAEVADAGTAEEKEEPVGRGGGYLWRLNSYWRFEERDGGLYIEVESISLTRGIPYGLAWAVGPFVTSLPRESLEFTLGTTRKVLVAQ
jgi:hypothetical protein